MMQYIINGVLEMNRKELEAFIYELIEETPTLKYTLNNFLTQHTIEHNVRASAVRLARELGFDVYTVPTETSLKVEAMASMRG